MFSNKVIKKFLASSVVESRGEGRGHFLRKDMWQKISHPGKTLQLLQTYQSLLVQKKVFYGCVQTVHLSCPAGAPGCYMQIASETVSNKVMPGLIKISLSKAN